MRRQAAAPNAATTSAPVPTVAPNAAGRRRKAFNAKNAKEAVTPMSANALSGLLAPFLFALACGCSHNPTHAELAQVYRTGMTRADAEHALGKLWRVETRPDGGASYGEGHPTGTHVVSGHAGRAGCARSKRNAGFHSIRRGRDARATPDERDRPKREQDRFVPW
jgi:hypothetical protein